MKLLLAFLATAFSATLAIPTALASPITVTNFAAWDGSASSGDFGASGFSAWGQFFTVPAGTNRLDSFTFYLSDALNGTGTQPVPVKVQAHLAAYDPVTRRLSSALLWSGAEAEVPLTDGLQFSPYTFAPNTGVTGGAVYQMFLFANNFDLQTPQQDSRLRLASMFGVSTYAGGAQNVPSNADGNLTAVVSGPWRYSGGDDLIFSATFSSTPTQPVSEPWTLALVGMAAGAGWLLRRRAVSI